MVSAPLQVTHIRPRQGWSSLSLREVWEFRELLYFLVWREVKGRYRQMALGPLWIVLKPFITMVVMSVVFGRLAKVPSDGLPYPLFNYAGLLPWTMFSIAVSKSSTSLVSNMSIISKVYFPRLVVPISTACAGLLDFCMSLIILVAMMVYYGHLPGWQAVFLPVYVLLAILTALALGLCLATVAVRYRDVGFAVDHLLQVAMYATPVVYPSSLVPETWRWLYLLNPMAVVIEGFRWSLLGKGLPPGPSLYLALGLVLLLLFLGAHHFVRSERTVVDLL